MADAARLALIVLVLAAVTLTAALLEPGWARDLDLLDWRPPWWLDPVAYGTKRPPPEELGHSERRREARERIVADLLGGRQTLFGAAALFRRLGEADGWQCDPDGRDGEHWC